MSAITTQIKKQRSARGLTQDQMAERLHLSTKAYQKIENGITKLDIERLNQIAEILEISVVDLINSDGGLYVNEVSHNNQVGFSSKDIIFRSEIPESERKLFEKIIQDKDKEIAFLRDLLKRGHEEEK